jgi:hypothetical protein
VTRPSPRASLPLAGISPWFAAAAGVAVAGVALITLPAAPAQAAEPQQTSFPPPEEDNGTARPAAPDTRTGHVYIAASVGAVGPVGSVGPSVATQSIAGVGYDVGGMLGVGIGRYGAVQIFGGRSVFSSPAGCTTVGCGGSSFVVGAGITYHLVQGIAFDPWGSFGMAYRGSLFQVVAPQNVVVDGQAYAANHLAPQNYQGLDVARIAFGGDYYPVPWFGFGPFVEVDVGTNLHRPAPLVTLPPNVIEGPRTYGFFQVGFRIAFDPMRHGPLPRAQAVGVTSPAGVTAPAPGM